MNYERFDTELTTAEPLSAMEIREAAIKRLIELRKEKKAIEQQEMDICMSISDPELNKKLITLTTKASVNIMQNELNYDNMDFETYKNFTLEDQELFDRKKYKPINKLHEKVLSSEEVSDGILQLKQDGKIDLRKQRHKKKPSEYLAGLALSKAMSDMAKSHKEMLQRIAKLEIASADHEDKIDQLGSAMLSIEARCQAMQVLGIHNKKIEAWKLHMENPNLSRQALADLLGKSKPTVIKWLQDVQQKVAHSCLR